MDTTPKYIEMCEKAWGDLKRDIYFSDIVYLKNYNGTGGTLSTGWVEGSAMAYEYVEDIKYPKPLFKMRCQCQDCIGFVVWKQDQLQKMILKDYETAGIGLSLMFYKDWLCSVPWTPEIKKWSMEQLTIAFVMERKYNKVWIETNWGRKQ